MSCVVVGAVRDVIIILYGGVELNFWVFTVTLKSFLVDMLS